MAQSSILILPPGVGVGDLEKTVGVGGLVVDDVVTVVVVVPGSVERVGAAAGEECRVLVPVPVAVQMQGPAGADLADPGRDPTMDFPSGMAAAADRRGTEGRRPRRRTSWSWLLS